MNATLTIAVLAQLVAIVSLPAAVLNTTVEKMDLVAEIPATKEVLVEVNMTGRDLRIIDHTSVTMIEMPVRRILRRTGINALFRYYIVKEWNAPIHEMVVIPNIEVMVCRINRSILKTITNLKNKMAEICAPAVGVMRMAG